MSAGGMNEPLAVREAPASYVVPEDWDVVQFGELGRFKNGINKPSEAFGHGTPFVNLMDSRNTRCIGAL